jgi:murein DD-endopeptidase MepM/ murein hydrolase activator NlpD
LSRSSRIVIAFILVLGLGSVAATYAQRLSVEQRFAQEAALAAEEARRIQEETILFTVSSISRGNTIADVLLRSGLPAAAVFQMIAQARPVYDLRMVRAGNPIAIGRSVLGDFRAVRYRVDLDRELWISARGPEFQAEMKPTEFTTEVVGVTGEIRNSLFNAVTDAGEGAELALQIADIFGWDMDFYTDPRPSDTFRVLVEKKTYRDSNAVRYARVFAAEYNNEGRAYQAVLFREPNGRPAYYAPDGKSLKKAFLRSPLKFGAPITSRFSNSRFHPVLKRHRPHLGIDYGAPTGTPVQSIGEGRVVFAGTKGGSGRMVHIRHANGYETMYLHLSRIFVSAGERVGQGDRIGLVGSTGLATGPHLDFRILQHGNYRNFERLQLPPALPVAKSDWDDFVTTRDRWLAQLPPPHDGSIRAAKDAAQAPPASSQ